MSESESVRLDKWLWAARFFRTRARAREAIEAGHVQVDGQRAKPSRTVTPGLALTILRGEERFEVNVVHCSAIRRGAPEAATLFEETTDSIQAREHERADRRMRASGLRPPPMRPDKHQRRDLERLKRGPEE